MLKKIISILCLVAFSFLQCNAAENTKLIIQNKSDGSFGYYEELLNLALTQANSDIRVEKFATPDLAQPRMLKEFEQGNINLLWAFQNADKDSKYTPIAGDITNGLLSQRILLIKSDSQKDFDNVKNLDDFRKTNKVGGFGKGWADVKIWQFNNLKFVEQDGDWKSLYFMLAAGNRGVDYFSRGAIEILPDFKAHPELAIEKNLVFKYDDQNYIFYISKGVSPEFAAKINKDLTAGLDKMRTDGSLVKLVEKYFGETMTTLNLKNRTVISVAKPQ